MFRRFKEISSDLKTSIRREEKDGKHENETVVHVAMVKYFRERGLQPPEWLEPDHHSRVVQHRMPLDKIQSGIRETNHAIKGQVEHIPKIKASRFSPQKPLEPPSNGIPQAPLPRRTTTNNSAPKTAHSITSRFSSARGSHSPGHSHSRPANSRFNIKKT
ncbi:hypothetical protein KL929_004730 [Ogataea haglerorum]|uniref:Mso1 N-terminal domain-containing protein n=1 Tax=Ogataea haglerorum TaxID=1937702 RepID=A0ABQ7RBJ9_9ASCO|nr:uncharacterized protein KL911_004542 [Ogataea haglerorum]KAG7693103.1 hypothetical protein KL951_004642 [Ogataea haglerorum]KAG7693653.1 hypothetical protein KL915_003943 [Ogataea haglerorum]KAG7703345.1 hypothetical protein KL914_004730 [Ogataea haglerorum]KAG7714348.1 hypothetical protein KL913_004545 [Ogataea haglerorum]KAG7715099.1 hypothetical protein KL949_004492 [Ogataea haglerorum]